MTGRRPGCNCGGSGETAGLLWASRGARMIFCAHVNHVFATLNLRDRAAAVIFALDHDIAGRGS